MQKSRYKIFIIILLTICAGEILHAQQPDSLYFEPDTSGFKNNIPISSDTLSVELSDTLRTDSLPVKRSVRTDVEANVVYSARDSMVFSIDGSMVELFGDASITYEDIVLKSDYVRYEMSNNLVTATGLPDSTGKIVNTPEFSDETNAFKSKTLQYNFKTRKGFIEEVVTEQEGGFLHATETKRHASGHIHLKNGIYTTCDADHPHFGIVITKGISMPGDKIISGPAYLVVEDVPLPIGLPFGFFPNSRTKTSGILIPQYGEEQRRGFYLRDGGYYFAMNDYMDLRITGDIYTNGTWGVRVGSNYKLNYRFNGSLRLQYFNNIQGYKNIEGLYSVTKDYSVNWSHAQDPRANPTSSFRANVNLSSTSYDQNHTRNINNVMTNTKQSSISYTKSWPNSPFNLSASLNHSQNSNTKGVNLTMPKVSFNMARLTPFKRKKPMGPKRWYEDIQLSYSSMLENRINTYDSLLFTSNVFDDMKNGYKHDIPLSLNIKPFNKPAFLQSFTITPNVRYTGMLYTALTERHITGYDEREVNGVIQYKPIIRDTMIHKLTYAHAFLPSVSSGIAPKVYGMYQFKGNGRVQAIRHMMTPSASFSYVPDMTAIQSDYYREVFDEVNGDTIAIYSIYKDQIYGTPTFNGASGSLNLSLKNNLEAKVLTRNDTVDKVEKIKLLDNFNFSTSYNFFQKDTLTPAWRPVSFNGNTRIFKDKLNITFRGTMDPFGYDDTRARTRETYFSQTGKPFRLTNAGISMGMSFRSKQEKKGSGEASLPAESQLNDPDMLDDGVMQGYDPTTDDYYGGYVDFNIPWSISLDYNFSYNKPRDVVSIVQTIRASGDFSLTPKWKIGFNTGYDIDRKQFTTTNISIYRDLHCWEMRISVVPFGTYKSYNFQINARSSILSDLKYNKRKSWQDNF